MAPETNAAVTTSANLLEWARLFLPWPVISLIAIFVFKKPLVEVLGQLKRLKAGPVEIERQLQSLAERGQEAVSNLDRTTEIMAASRLLELEITNSKFGGMFTEEQRRRMEDHIKQLRALTRSPQ